MTGDAVHRGCAGVHIRRYIQTGRELCQTHQAPPDLLSRREGGDVCRQGELECFFFFEKKYLHISLWLYYQDFLYVYYLAD